MTRLFSPDTEPSARAEMVLALRPHDEDYDLVFLPPHAAHARAAYRELWNNLPVLTSPERDCRLKLAVDRAVDFGSEGPASAGFPGGYRLIADRLAPDKIWVSWQLVSHGETTGMQFDGLVYLDGRFAWFPKPWRVL